MDVGDWLRNQGLGRYEKAFREHALDLDVLPDLTDGDLAQIGVALGDRKRLLKAIAGLSLPRSPPPAAWASPPPPAPAPARKTSHVAAERRPITVLFCDLVGSTALAAKLDAEDWRDLAGAYVDAASEAVTRYGGHVLQKLGDGIMALFGYPHAEENDTERAVRAALAILRALEALNAMHEGRGIPKLAARIGLDMGLVVVDAAGEVYGDAPNVAARAQTAAEPGSVFVTAAVQRQIAGLFVAEDRGAHDLKGVSGPVTLYRLVRASGGRRRGGSRALTPFVGREEDLALLMRCWERARSGEGQFVQIVGEPGIGKSRLIEEFRARLGARPHTWVEWASSQLMQNTPLHPLVEWGRLRFGGPEVAPEKRLADLEQTLAAVKLDPAENVPLLAPLLDIPLAEARAPKLAPDEMRSRQLAAIAALVMAGARAQALVLAVEDLHWADPTTLDLMERLAERAATAPLFVVATMRPEFRAPWATRSHHGVVSLVPLNRAEIRAMVGAIAERHALSNEVLNGVADRTGGVPLFVEEVTRLLLERGDAGGAQAIPPTLQQSLAARLDRIGDAREVAQIGAVLGREFSYRLLSAVASATAVTHGGGLSEAALQSALDRLVEADLLFVEGHAPVATYRFKHALIQDAAYDNLLKSRRQALHRRAAEALIAAPDPQPELVAHHFSQAGDMEPAIEWWGRAGDAALRRSAFQEAIAHLGKAIEMADREGQAAAAIAPGQRLKLQTDFGQALMWSKGFAAQETAAAFSRAGELAAQSSEDVDSAVVYHAEFWRRFIRGDVASAHEIAETFLRAAESDGRPVDRRAALRILALSLIMQGRLELARDHIRRALSDDSSEEDIESRRRFGGGRVSATSYAALASWLLGDLEEARELIERAVREGGDSAHAVTKLNVNVFRAWIEAIRGDAQAVLGASQTCIQVADQQQLALYLSYANMFSSWAQGALFGGEACLGDLRKTLADVLQAGNRFGGPFLLALKADLEARNGRVEEALASVDAGLSLAKETGEHWSDSVLLRHKGEFLLRRDGAGSELAEDAFWKAIAIAHEQGARIFGLRAALSLAKLRHSTGRAAEARAVLAPALEGFAPTPEMPEIAEAQALMERLA
ncbi:AAA family ATPase [Roseiarcus sp.]|uniref:adenylate/guanylate cyclase domain-containing protein n=1 Tax=Roseiarcus sp. TaxID=1969460 RepID=UPI002CAEB803|nr:AAA family ATPase [Roseiarcus sp.]